MPRYYFHVRDGIDSFDAEGTECATPADARAQALRTAGAILVESSASFWRHPHWQMSVVDDAGAPVLTLTLRAQIPSEENSP